MKQFVGREPASVKMIFIPTAGNPDDDVWWIDKDRDVLTKMGFVFTELDIAGKDLQQLNGILDDVDLVYIAGGYTYYLLEQIRKSGFDEILRTFVERGGMYVGASAGALIAGPDIEPCSTLDDPSYGPTLQSSHGLDFVDFVPMPHYDMSERNERINSIIDKYKNRYQIVPMSDDEAIIADGQAWEKVNSKRSELERKWFERFR